MAEEAKISINCTKCGRQFQCKAPAAPGHYSVVCPHADCREKISFQFSGHKDIPANQSITEEDLLKCRMSGCKGMIIRPEGVSGVYSSKCDECSQQYSLVIQDSRIMKVSLVTPKPLRQPKQCLMKLVCGGLVGKKEYVLFKGVHYIGRYDPANNSHFPINDKYASSKSIRIDVNENAGSLLYKMTVERAMNPVYHNMRELAVDDIVYLSYGDTIKLGKTLIKVQKVNS